MAASVLALSPAAAQPDGGKVHRVGVLTTSHVSAELTQSVTLPALEKLGFVRGRNLEVEYGVGPVAELPALAARLLAVRSDVIVAVGGDATRAATTATSTVPIVIYGPDPVRLGLVPSLATPGGNLTGLSILATELDAKRLSLLHEAMPRARRVGALIRLTFAQAAQSEGDMRKVAGESNLDLVPIYVTGPAGYADAFSRMRAAGLAALVITADPEFFRDTAALMALAQRERLPMMCQWREMTSAGCLLSYGPDLTALRRRLADYIARVLRGTHPRDMPIEQPATFDLVINVKVARALGIILPHTLLARADEVIE